MEKLPITCRPARPSERAAINDLAFRAKAHWGYSVAQMEAWRADLALAPTLIARQQVLVALHDGALSGVVAIDGDSGEWRLEHLWVDPFAMGQGIGRALLRAACACAHRLHAQALVIDADPNAAGFYRACGAEQIGAIPAPIAGNQSRTLAVFRLMTASLTPNNQISHTPCSSPSSLTSVRLKKSTR